MTPTEMKMMRAYIKELKKQYNEDKLSAFESLKKLLKETPDHPFTAWELAAATGLSPEEIFSNLCYPYHGGTVWNYRADLFQSVDYEVKREEVERTFVEVLPDGTINKDRVIHKTEMTIYFVGKP